ncbi:MAG: putative PEP-binding protein, partial [Microvirga sp.]
GVSMSENGDAIIVDGENGTVHLRPPPDLEAAYAEKVRFRARRQELYRELRSRPAATPDGFEVTLLMNAGLAVDLPQLADSGAAGIGLFRTELQFMIAERMPTGGEQQKFYQEVLAAAGDKPVTFRTLDIGGDKILPYMQKEEEQNPALGWRAIRISLDRPGLLRSQIRALLKAAAGRRLKVMFPMVATCDEFARAKAVVRREQAYLARHGRQPPASVELGAMIEVPSLLFEIDDIASAADFLSVGSNDLMQYLFAADRENRRVANRFDPLSPPSLRALKLIVKRAAAAECPVTVCGEMGSKPLEAMALIGLGFRDISMAPASVGPVKAMVLQLESARVSDLLAEELSRPGVESLRPALAELAENHGIPV